MNARTFLLSPAFCGGRRAQMLLSGKGSFDLAKRMRLEGAAIGEVFTFLSGLYFRGKLAYANRFAMQPLSGAKVITPDRGLISIDETIDLADLRAFANVEVDLGESRYVAPLVDSIRALSRSLAHDAQFVLLGSIATDKYSGVLLPTLGSRLVFPTAFRGRGDMSRGALLLRAAASGLELDYEPVPEIAPKRRRAGKAAFVDRGEAKS